MIKPFYPTQLDRHKQSRPDMRQFLKRTNRIMNSDSSIQAETTVQQVLDEHALCLFVQTIRNEYVCSNRVSPAVKPETTFGQLYAQLFVR